MSRTVRIVAIIAAIVIVAVAAFTQLGGQDAPTTGPDVAETAGIVPGSPVPPASEAAPTPEPTADLEDDAPGPADLQEPGANHAHDDEHSFEGQDPVLTGLREATPQESAAMTAVSGYMRMDSLEDAAHRRERLRQWFTPDASEPSDPLPAAVTNALEGIIDSRLTHVTTLDDGGRTGRAVVEIGLLRNMVLTLDRSNPPVTSGGNMVFTAYLEQVDGQWLVSELNAVNT